MATIAPFARPDNAALPEERTVAALCALYTRDVLPQLAPMTQGGYQRVLDRFRAYCGALPLAQLTPQVLTDWQWELRQRLSPGSVCLYLVVCSAVLDRKSTPSELQPHFLYLVCRLFS